MPRAKRLCPEYKTEKLHLRYIFIQANGFSTLKQHNYPKRVGGFCNLLPILRVRFSQLPDRFDPEREKRPTLSRRPPPCVSLIVMLFSFCELRRRSLRRILHMLHRFRRILLQVLYRSEEARRLRVLRAQEARSRARLRVPRAQELRSRGLQVLRARELRSRARLPVPRAQEDLQGPLQEALPWDHHHRDRKEEARSLSPSRSFCTVP